MIMLVSRIRLERILTDPQRRACNVLGLKEEKNKLGLIVGGDTIWHFLLFSFFSNPIEKKLIFRLNDYRLLQSNHWRMVLYSIALYHGGRLFDN